MNGVSSLKIGRTANLFWRHKKKGTPAGVPSISEPTKSYALNELPQPQVDLTLGLLNLKPEPSRVST